MSKPPRERTAREKLAAERRRQQQRSRRVRNIVAGLGALLIVGVLVTVVVVARSGEDLPSTYQGDLAPVSRQADGSILMARAGVTGPLLEIFEDFQCPACKELEDTAGTTVKKLAAEGKVKVVYRPFHLFSSVAEPTRSNSRRAINAALCAPAGNWMAYHDVLFKNQPSETEKGFENADLVAWGRSAGITDPAFAKCVTDGQRSAQVEATRVYALETRKVEGTPTLFLNGRKLDDDVAFSRESLRSAILAAKVRAARPGRSSPRPAAGERADPPRRDRAAGRRAGQEHGDDRPAGR